MGVIWSEIGCEAEVLSAVVACWGTKVEADTNIPVVVKMLVAISVVVHHSYAFVVTCVHVPLFRHVILHSVVIVTVVVVPLVVVKIFVDELL